MNGENRLESLKAINPGFFSPEKGHRSTLLMIATYGP